MDFPDSDLSYGFGMAIDGSAIVVAGFVTEGSASPMVLARFLPAQELTSITVSPTTTTVADGTTTQFTATALDEFGNPMATQPAFTWSVVGTGTINSSGVYTAPSGSGTDTVQAAADGVTGSATVYYPVLPPTVTTPATATLSSQGTSASLSVSATDPNPGATIASYTWSYTGPSGVTFSSNNGSSTGNNAIATFTQLGTYSFTVTITDSLPIPMITTSSVQLIVVQVLTNITVSPASGQVSTNQTLQFTALAYDQFGTLMTEQPTISWRIVSGSGSILQHWLVQGSKEKWDGCY